VPLRINHTIKNTNKKMAIKIANKLIGFKNIAVTLDFLLLN